MRSRFLLCLLGFARIAAAQTTRGAVNGVVHNSLANAPLAGAQVQLVAADSLGRFGRTVVSDSLGRFSIPDVPAGRYTIGFFHPMLDSLGLEPTLHEVRLDGESPIRADLAIPSPERLRTAICKSQPGHDSGTVVVGVIRDARSRMPIARATVMAEWLELALSRQGIARRLRQVTATTTESGWFSICNTPAAGTIVLAANHGIDSTDRIDLSVPAMRFVRRDLYLGAAAGDVSERVPVNVVEGAPPVRVALLTMQSVLDTVKVTSSSRWQHNLREFEDRRRSSGVGRFLTRDDIDRRNPVVTSELFRMVPGLSADRRDSQNLVQMQSVFGGMCSLAVYIDGAFMSDLSADEIDNMVRPEELGAIEVYVAPTIPAQFTTGMGMARNGGASSALSGCGSIAIWTRPARRRPGSETPARPQS